MSAAQNSFDLADSKTSYGLDDSYMTGIDNVMALDDPNERQTVIFKLKCMYPKLKTDDEERYLEGVYLELIIKFPMRFECGFIKTLTEVDTSVLDKGIFDLSIRLESFDMSPETVKYCIEFIQQYINICEDYPETDKFKIADEVTTTKVDEWFSLASKEEVALFQSLKIYVNRKVVSDLEDINTIMVSKIKPLTSIVHYLGMTSFLHKLCALAALMIKNREFSQQKKIIRSW